MKNYATSKESKTNREQQDETVLRRRAAEDAVQDADSYAIRVRRQFEKVTTSCNRGPSVSSLSKESAKAKAGLDEEVDGVLIHSVEGTTRLILSDEILQISNASEVESIGIDPIRLFHVQSRAPWMQQVRPGAA